jgi:hypothetical protein
MAEERRENIMPVELAIQREQAYRRKVAMLQLKLDEDLIDLMPLQVWIQIEDILTLYHWQSFISLYH